MDAMMKGRRMGPLLACAWLLHGALATVITIETTQPIHRVEPFFLSYCIDAYLLQENPRWLNFDFKSEKLRTLMRGLAPALLRFGGSPADWTVFTNDLAGELHLNASGTDPANQGFTKHDLDQMVNLTRDTGNRFLFDLDLQLRYGKQWDPSNAMNMMEYMQQMGYGDNVDFELGNEPGAYNRPEQAKMDPDQVGKDFRLLTNLVRSFPNLNKSMIVGPDSVGIKPSSLGNKILASVIDKAGEQMTAATFHHYYFRGDLASVKDYIDPKYFSDLQQSIDDVKDAIRKTSNPNMPIWIGETADAWHSGTANVSDRFVSGFLWLDKLGLSAREGVGVVMRQTLYGHNYGLLDLNLRPNPDYWLSALHKALVGRGVLQVSTWSPLANTTRVYAHCAGPMVDKAGAVTVFALNMHMNDSADLLLGQYFKHDAYAFILTPPNQGDILSPMIAVNGQVLQLKDNRTLPDVTPKVIPANRITLPPLTLGFFVIKDANAEACA